MLTKTKLKKKKKIDSSFYFKTDLIHAGIDEEQAGVSPGPDRGGRNQKVSVFDPEEVQEGAADPGSGQLRWRTVTKGAR